jgi:putative ABC transport system permease protein
MMEYVQLSIKNLSYQKARALLTLLGVIIGIMAVVSMISIGTGMKVALDEALGVLGSDKILVTPKMTYGALGETFTDEDSDEIEKIPGVRFVSPMVSVTTNAEFKGEEKPITVWGLDPVKADKTFSGASGYDIADGRWIQKGDRNKISIGSTVRDDFFERRVSVGNTIKIKGEPFKVVGIFEKTGDRDSDAAVYADLDQVREIFGMDGRITLMIVRIDKGQDIDRVQKRIEDLLEKRRGNEDFAVITPKQMSEQIGEAFSIVSIVFGGLAAVSLIVGGVGIANTMIMNVMERRKEIGIMKATGAANDTIMKMFLVESGVIGVIGGIIGIFLGYLISVMINIAAETYLGPGILRTSVSIQTVVFALGFSFVVGVLSGIFPAYRALKLDPVDALRD